MRPPLFVLLVLAVATAPATAVSVVDGSASKAKTKQEKDKAADEQNEQPEDDADQDQRAPTPTAWTKLTPGQTAGGGGAPDDDDCGPGERPELPPAFYARRLPAAPRIEEPPCAPVRAVLKSGLISLPPPLS